MREISPASNVGVEEFLLHVPASARALVARIREQKREGTRPSPSVAIIDRSALLVAERRYALLDRVAALVDENLVGRAEMCLQFADLLAKALTHLGLSARAVVGEAIYSDATGAELFRWRHAWVRVGEEVIDGNVDILAENPMVPSSVRVLPYWGPIRETPSDRHLRERRGETLLPDEDVDAIWWPELRQWLDNATS
jgi:hypothetical protein